MQLQRGFRHQGAVVTLQSKLEVAFATRTKDVEKNQQNKINTELFNENINHITIN